MSRAPAVFAVLLAAACFATTGTAQELADVGASATSVGAARIVVGGGILGLVALLAARSTGPVAPTSASRLPTWLVVAVGAAGVVAYQPFFFAGTAQNGVAVGTVVALGSAPVATGVLDALVRRQLPSLRWCAATAVALAGVVLVSGLVGAGPGALHVAGVASSVAAGASYALYALAGKLLLDRGWSASASMGATFGAAAVASVPLLLLTSTAWLTTPRGLALVLWLGLVTTAVAYLLFGWGLRRLEPTTVATLTLAEPLGATLLGLLVLQERLTGLASLGLVVLVLGLAILSLPQRRGRRLDVAPAA
ncbi:DME family drug/metabolite transporter [Nocardioides zeae]|uniref:DME family drug/metabolite transporter n=1 Tax=Nocardioides zeae TaxID=1457234 RepID=A0ACC6IFR5_9ACTN|nr:EamA family transporter [Nocardioides zeae]MDR6176473.1 DME family drug/metabolite transporter [Nocardioides zeae]MDR6209485.1 DME family drug/metabolite transporter [Nocardioides zeae]